MKTAFDSFKRNSKEMLLVSAINKPMKRIKANAVEELRTYSDKEKILRIAEKDLKSEVDHEVKAEIF